MIIKRPWAFWRRMQYLIGFAVLFSLIGWYVYVTYFYTEPTCFDGVQNGGEVGVDCGGECVQMCASEVTPLSVLWARSFEVAAGQYNAVAYVENRNESAGVPDLQYTFTLYDDTGVITTREGTATIPPDSVYPVFEGRIDTGDRIPKRTFLELTPPDTWLPAAGSREQFTLVSRILRDIGTAPRLDAVLRNDTLTEVNDVEVIATIFDQNKNALTASRTVIPELPPQSEREIVFTWPQPIASTIRSCEVPTDVVLALDVSGSMNDDGGTPPEPITSVKESAAAFVNRLEVGDQAGVVTFASEATSHVPLTGERSAVARAITTITIPDAEEHGVTNTGAAILRSIDQFRTAAHNPDARKVLVLVTDGLATAPEPDPEGYATRAASAAARQNIQLYGIGLGEQVNMEFVETLVGDSSFAYQAISRGEIGQIYSEITAALCEDGPAIIEVIPKTSIQFAGSRSDS